MFQIQISKSDWHLILNNNLQNNLLNGKQYPHLVPKDVLDSLPLPWKTLGFYFDHLCELGILNFSPIIDKWAQKGNYRFNMVSKMPQASQASSI